MRSSNNKDSLAFWTALYRAHRNKSVCLDIETEGINKPITVIGVYQNLGAGKVFIQLVQEINLTHEFISMAFYGAKLIITFNGIKHDIPRIRHQFPNCLPSIPVLDLHLFAKRCGLKGGLKALEKKYGIIRSGPITQRHVSVKLWRQFRDQNNSRAFSDLLEYNRQDTINLLQLADKLILNSASRSRSRYRPYKRARYKHSKHKNIRA